SVHEAPSELLREERPYRGLAGTHEASQDNALNSQGQICIRPHALYALYERIRLSPCGGGRWHTAFVLIRLVSDRRADVVPDCRTGIVDRQKQLRLLGDIFEITDESGTVFAGFQVLFCVWIRMRLEHLRQSFLKFSTIHIVCTWARGCHTALSFRCPVRSRSR